eukprot:scaffold2771_cov252-Pinguiococcus_pyrenoidosus.AAC.15
MARNQGVLASAAFSLWGAFYGWIRRWMPKRDWPGISGNSHPSVSEMRKICADSNESQIMKSFPVMHLTSPAPSQARRFWTLRIRAPVVLCRTVLRLLELLLVGHLPRPFDMKRPSEEAVCRRTSLCLSGDERCGARTA